MAASAWRIEEADSCRPLQRAASKARGYKGYVGPEARRLPRRGAGQAHQKGSEEQLAALDVRHLPQINDSSLLAAAYVWRMELMDLCGGGRCSRSERNSCR